MRSPLVALVTLASFLLLVLAPRGALAADDAATVEAKQHFEAGRTAYLGGDYARAISEFEQAQRLRPSPILDYNIGLACEGMGDAGNAYAAYQRYLTARPDAQNRAEVEQSMARLAQQLQPSSTGNNNAARPAPGAGDDPYGQPTYEAPAKKPAAPAKKKSYWWIVFPIIGGVALTGLIIWAAASSGTCGPPDCNGTYLHQPLSLQPADPGPLPMSASPVLPGEVLRF